LPRVAGELRWTALQSTSAKKRLKEFGEQLLLSNIPRLIGEMNGYGGSLGFEIPSKLRKASAMII
jgi:hypothetical protein